MNGAAPIVLFAYRRPGHLAKAIAALTACPESSRSDLVVFSDGPRNAEARAGVEEVRKLVRGVTGFSSVRCVERDSNWGLSRNVADGVSQEIGARGRAIVLEDDLEVAPSFLSYMNGALALYEDDERVASIHGYVYPTGTPLPETFFLRGADCWGWATWSRAWSHYAADAAALLDRLERCPWKPEFDFGGAYPYTRMLRDAGAGRVDSWAIRWNASAFVDGMYTLYPGISLVRNIGHDGSGTHGGATTHFETGLADRAPALARQEPAVDPVAYDAFRSYFLTLRPSLAVRLGRLLRDRLGGPRKR
jgi:hypothetical protein